MGLAFRRLKSQLLELCDAYQERVHDIAAIRELVQAHELGVAFDILCNRFIEADSPTLSISEFEQLAVVGEGLGLRSEWVNLIACLKPTDRHLIPLHLRTLAEKHLASEVPRNSTHREWLQRLRKILELEPG